MPARIGSTHPRKSLARPSGRADLAASWPSSVRIELSGLSANGKRATRAALWTTGHTPPNLRKVLALISRLKNKKWTARLAALSSVRRQAILAAISAGATRHQQIAKSAKLAAGPLYFHLRDLERAELILIRARNTYELTQTARDLLVTLPILMSGMKTRKGLPSRGVRSKLRLKAR